MTPMIWPICCDDFSMRPMASTARRTTSPLFSASFLVVDDDRARMLRALGGLASTVAVISSSAAAVSSRLAACCSVRRDRSSAALVISMEAVPMSIRAARHMADRRFELRHRRVEILLQTPIGVRERILHAMRQVSLRQGLEPPADGLRHGVAFVLENAGLRSAMLRLDALAFLCGARLRCSMREAALLEALQGARHIAQFIDPPQPGYSDAEVFSGDMSHLGRDGQDGLDDRRSGEPDGRGDAGRHGDERGADHQPDCDVGAVAQIFGFLTQRGKLLIVEGRHVRVELLDLLVQRGEQSRRLGHLVELDGFETGAQSTPGRLSAMAAGRAASSAIARICAVAKSFIFVACSGHASAASLRSDWARAGDLWKASCAAIACG